MNDEGLTWTTPPAETKKRLAIFGVALFAMAIGLFVFRQPLLGLLGLAMILGATADHWLGTRFTLDAKGATAKTGLSVTAMEWKDVRRILEQGREIRLSPLESPSTLDSFRGVGLVPTAENREAVLAYIHRHVERLAPRPSAFGVGEGL